LTTKISDRGSLGSKLPWVVLKFGGTSVSSVTNWSHIARIVRERLAAGLQVLVVHSALSGVTDRLEKLLTAGLQSDSSAADAALADLVALHHQLICDLNIDALPILHPHFLDLQTLISPLAGLKHIDDRTRAAVMAIGELLSTKIGATYLNHQGLASQWFDARTVLRAEVREASTVKSNYLSATCDFKPNTEVQKTLNAFGKVMITQGFIASDSAGDTVLLGRGGSDTSSAYFAALLEAQHLEIWTDVPGMFSANPRVTSAARQLLELTYDEAQEIATAGAKVLHPRCLLPARQYQIPIYVFATHASELLGTRITQEPITEVAQVKAICMRKGVTLVSMDSPGMWHQVGFLADAFQIFKRLGISIDLVSTSETNVTVSLDPQVNTLDNRAIQELKNALSILCRAEIIGSCASVSVVGRNIRSILHKLGDALQLFADQKIYLVSQAANNLNLTFVVDEDQGDRLVNDLHELLVRPARVDAVLGPTWEHLFETKLPISENIIPWWHSRRNELISLMKNKECIYVYDSKTIQERCKSLLNLNSISRVSYAMKANSHPDVLALVHHFGLSIECVSRGEIERALKSINALRPADILFTPNFASREEYVWALELGVQLTLDNLHPLNYWPELFKNRNLFVRVDLGVGRGHHLHVRTGGEHSKFGVAIHDLPQFARTAHQAGAKIIGLHSHAGSGVFDVHNWSETAYSLSLLKDFFPEVKVLNIGGGLGVPDRDGAENLNISGLDAVLLSFTKSHPDLQLWLEPGRFVIAEAGVLLVRVTQLKAKGTSMYVGVSTGMNSLIRPALYGAHHDIVNLSRLSTPATLLVDVVGPICEAGDVLGHALYLPAETCEGDVLLITTVGAYGAAMSSQYNLRLAAPEILI